MDVSSAVAGDGSPNGDNEDRLVPTAEATFEFLAWGSPPFLRSLGQETFFNYVSILYSHFGFRCCLQIYSKIFPLPSCLFRWPSRPVRVGRGSGGLQARDVRVVVENRRAVGMATVRERREILHHASGYLRQFLPSGFTLGGWTPPPLRPRVICQGSPWPRRRPVHGPHWGQRSAGQAPPSVLGDLTGRSQN